MQVQAPFLRQWYWVCNCSAGCKGRKCEEKAGYEVNYALNSKVTASNQELANQWGPEKAVDGIVNRDAEKPEQSRWSTAQSTTQEARTLTLDLGAVKTFSQFVIEWERTNITNFKISVSDTEDGTYKDVYVKEDGKNITSLTSRINLEKAATGRFVRLTVNGYTLNRVTGSLYLSMSSKYSERLRT